MYGFDISVILLFFFFKQKTAYEMRISDWSSDVCSSDLQLALGGAQRLFVGERLEGADAALLEPVELHREQHDRKAEEEDAERPSDPLEQPAIGDAHSPFAVADAEFLVIRVQAHRAVAEDERSRRPLDRKSVEEGKRGSESVYLGGRRYQQKKKKK